LSYDKSREIVSDTHVISFLPIFFSLLEDLSRSAFLHHPKDL